MLTVKTPFLMGLRPIIARLKPLFIRGKTPAERGFY